MLSIDGGRIRSLIPATIIVGLKPSCRYVNKPLSLLKCDGFVTCHLKFDTPVLRAIEDLDRPYARTPDYFNIIRKDGLLF